MKQTPITYEHLGIFLASLFSVGIIGFILYSAAWAWYEWAIPTPAEIQQAGERMYPSTATGTGIKIYTSPAEIQGSGKCAKTDHPVARFKYGIFLGCTKSMDFNETPIMP